LRAWITLRGMAFPPPIVYHQPPRRQSNRTTRIVLIVVGSVLALCCVLTSIGAYLLYRTVSDAIGPVRAEANQFLTDLEAQAYSSAYDRLCSSARERFTVEQFTARVQAQRPTRHDLVGTNVSNVNGFVSATVTARITYATGFTDDHVLRMAKENGAWRVCGNPY
jgi:hypothetical protein